jgi:DNA polymerase I-like protein with 3'-5' exonuclease and polymerase domains/intein/homing endonuclease
MAYATLQDYAKKIRSEAYFAAITCQSYDCPLFNQCAQFASMGKKYSKIPMKLFFVFDSPQQDDVNESAAAVSAQGQYFRDNWLSPFLGDVGCVSYLISHLVRSPLLDGKGASRNATAAEAAYCWEHFYTDLMEYRPAVIVAFGASVFNQLYRKAKNKETLPDPDSLGVGKLRLNPLVLQFADDYSPTVYVGYAPGYILRSPASAAYFAEDRDRVVNHFCPNKRDLTKQEIKIDNIDLIDTVKGALDFLDFLTRGLPKNEDRFDLAFDSETDNLNRVFNNKFLSWQFSWKPGHAVFIPIEHPDRPIFADIADKVKLIEAFQNLLNSSPEKTNIGWILGHNLKFDLSILYGLYRILPRGSIPLWDTLLGMHWLDENRKAMGAVLDGRPYSLKTLGKELFGFTYQSDALAARADGDLVALKFDDLVEYGGSDTILTWHLKQEQMRLAKLQKNDALPKLERFMRYYYSPATRAVAFMECNGLSVATSQLQYLQGEDSPIWNRISRIENVELQNSPEVVVFRDKYKKILKGETNLNYEEDLWGEDDVTDSEAMFNPSKKDQETAFYLDFLKLEPIKFSKKTNKATMNKEFLNHYASPEVYQALPAVASHVAYYKTPISQDEEGDPVLPKNPLQLILELRELSKLGNTYLESIGEMIGDKKGDCIDGRVRASYWLAGTDTGRLSSSDPNLQNLPSGRSKMAKEVKNLFQAESPSKRFPEGTVLIQLDYKTAEVRWAAIFANDKNLIRLFNEARESLIKACDPSSNMSNEDFEKTQLASDIHRRTASLMFGVPPNDVSKMMRQTSKCLIGSTKLFTNKGLVSISDLVTDKDNDDNWCQPVSNVVIPSTHEASSVLCINHKWVDSTIKLDTKIGISIQGDEDHPLLVWDNCEIIARKLKDIKEGDFLIVPRSNDIWSLESPKIEHTIENEISDVGIARTVQCQICGENLGNLTRHLQVEHAISSEDYCINFPEAKLVSPMQIVRRMNSLLGTVHNTFVPKCPNRMTPSLASILGYLVAEGDGQRYSMSGNVQKSSEMLQDFLCCLSDCFGLSPEIREYPEITTTGIITVPQKVVRYLLNLGLIKGYSNTQRVPEIIFRSTKEEVIAFLRSYFEGEGSVKSNAMIVMSASESLMQDIQLLLLNLNIISTRFSEDRITPVGKELRTYYGLQLGIRDARLFRDTVGFISQHKQKQADAIKDSAGHDSIYGLDQLLKNLKLQYKISKGKLHRYAINGKSVRFGERISKAGGVEYTQEKLASRPYVLEALKLWSEKEHNLVYESVSWLHQTKAMLVRVDNKTVIKDRMKVYDIEVNNLKHVFVANGLLSQNCITFGLLFGMGTETLANNNGWTSKEAEEKVEKFFSAFPQLRSWLEANPKKAKANGYVETIMGRRRRLDFLFATKNFRDEAKASRLSMNAPIQGQSSDGGIIGLCQFLQYLLDNNLERRWIIQNVVHDSCLVQVPMADIEKALIAMQYYFVDGMAEYIKQHFDFTLPLPIECEIEVGLKYGDLTKWDGRPSTLPILIEKLKQDAQKLWYSKKEKTGKPIKDLDLVKWKGK